MRKSIAQATCARQMRILFGVPRPSPVTDEVRRLFETQDRHAWSIEDLHETVRSSLGSADYSSVFRAVSLLERQGMLDRIDLGDGRARFEVREGHHEHIRCESCGRVDEVPGCVLDDASAQVHSLTGFKVTSHRVVFGGLCRECSAAKA
ncbi:MAG: transcriptional repressor [Chloroflexi bacterium]|nr:MAG: transcriptional repressor [Chloroflexota bacterium]